MTEEEKQLQIMSNKVAQVLGERLEGLSRGQEASLNKALGRVFDSHQGQASQVTEDEIEGAYQVMEMFYPADALELSERYQALQNLYKEN